MCTVTYQKSKQRNMNYLFFVAFLAHRIMLDFSNGENGLHQSFLSQTAAMYSFYFNLIKGKYRHRYTPCLQKGQLIKELPHFEIDTDAFLFKKNKNKKFK